MIQRNTVQRQQVLKAVCTLHNHPTAEDVYAYTSRHFPGLGKATVYRNLNVLAEQGLLQRVPVADGADRFDDTLQAHYHVRCVRCGRFEDVDGVYEKKIDRRVEKLLGYRGVHHTVVFDGLCPACAAAQDAADKA